MGEPSKSKYKMQPEKCSQGMTGLPPCSRQVFLGEAGLYRKSNKKRACTPQYLQTPKHREGVDKSRALPWQLGAPLPGKPQEAASSPQAAGKLNPWERDGFPAHRTALTWSATWAHGAPLAITATQLHGWPLIIYCKCLIAPIRQPLLYL